MSVEILSGASAKVIDPRGAGETSSIVIGDEPLRVTGIVGDISGSGVSESSLMVSPGWVDLHAHVFDGSTQISVAPDSVGIEHGVHLVADAGSAGHQSVDGFHRYVVPAAETQVVSWLNIGSGGLINLRETEHAKLIDVDQTIAAARARPDFVRGIKVRSSGAIVGDMGIVPLQLGKLAARSCGLPLLVHIGEAPPLIDDVLDLLDEGDSITHCYHGKTGHPWERGGGPSPALLRAIGRGVRLDVGHGAASLDIDVARAAIDAGYLPHTISTDIHVRNIRGPVHSLAAVMTKMLDCGMSLGAVIEAVTYAPRDTLGLPLPWLADDGTILHGTVFEVSDLSPEGRTYVDSSGKPLAPRKHIVARGVVRDGVFREIAAV